MSGPAETALGRQTITLSNGAGDFGLRIVRALGALGVEVAGGGAVDGVVHVLGAGLGEDRLLNDLEPGEWDAGAEAPIRAALAAVQAAFVALSGRGGSLVLVVPSIALTGAAGLVPLASAAEGVRLMGKSAARAWGTRGIRVNTITAPVAEWVPDLPVDHVVPTKQGPSLSAARESAAEVAALVVLLCSPLASGVTGATIGVDRGTLLAP